MGERRGEVYTGSWWGGVREGAHLRDPDVDRRIILRYSESGMGYAMDQPGSG